MRKLKNFLCFLFCTIFCLQFLGCNTTSTLDFTCFNTAVHVEVTGKSMSDDVKNTIKNALNTLEVQFSATNGTFTNTFNNLETNNSINASDTAIEIMDLSKELHYFTNGKFNPAVYPLVKLWQFSPNYPVNEFRIPDIQEITSFTTEKYLNLDNVIIDKESKKISKISPISVDFGGILKGYASDLIADILTDNGYKKGYINIGGSSLKVLASNSLAIRHPENVNNNIIRVNTNDLTNFSVSTSGTYERYYTFNGKTYSHIISPETGYPTETGIISSTVIGTNGAFGDAVTTALCLSEFDKENPESSQVFILIEKILVEYPNALVFVVYNKDSDKLIITNKESDYFTLLDDTYTIINI